MTNCGFTLLLCPNECKKGNKTVKLLRKDVEAHKKKVCQRQQYKCPHCRESGEYQERTTTHLEECPKMKILCPNDGCDENNERCNIPQHRQECLFERFKVPCSYADIGCKINLPRKDMKEHQNDSQHHLQVAIDIVKKHEDKIAQLQSTSGSMKFRITDFDKLKISGGGFYSPAIYTSTGGYKMCACVYANGSGDGKGTHLTAGAYLMRGENDNHLPWPFTGTVTFELLNQLKDDNHHFQETAFHPDNVAGQRVVNEERASVGYGLPCYIPHSDLGYYAAKNCQYLKDNCLYFRVKVDAEGTSKPWLV